MTDHGAYPAPSTAAALATARRAPEPPPATDREALAAILEALDIPYAASVGDDEIRAKILDQRLGHTLAMLRDWLGKPLPGDQDSHRAWSLGYLREQLAKHPATGYRTDYAEVMADWAASTAAKLRAAR